MGRPKALLDFAGTSVVELVLAVCRMANLETPILVTRADDEPLVERARRAEPRVVVVENLHPERGQTSSLQVGLAALAVGTEAFLIFPVDYPLVRAEDIAQLAHAFVARPGVRVVAPSFGGRRGHPVLVGVALAAELRALAPASTARDVLWRDPSAVHHVEMQDDRTLQDMDTPEAYAACVARYGHETQTRGLVEA